MEVFEKKSFPANMLDFKSYDGMKTFVAFIFAITIFYFSSGILSLLFWENSWFWPDTAHKIAIFSFRLFILTTIYCIAWLTFDKKSLESYAFAIFSFVFGVVYIITPFDFIPDIVPFISTIDDAVVGGGSILAAALSYKKSSLKNETTEKVLELLNNGKDYEAFKLLLHERGLTIVENNDQSSNL